MSDRRGFRVAATSARVVTGALVAAACVVGTVVAISAPWPSVAREPARAEVIPLPGDTVLACTGDLRAIGRDTANPLEMVAAAPLRLTLDGSAGAPESSSLSAADLVGSAGVPRIVGEVSDREAPLLGATESITVQDGDLFGFAAAPCRPASAESWLVGGTVATGTEDLVILTNPGAVPSTVAMRSYGSVRGTSTVIVPAESQIAVPLTSFAAGSDIPIVHLTTTGAPVRAVLQSSLTRTLDPAGIDLQDAVAAPQRRSVIPGVEMFESPSEGSEMAVLRLLSTDVDATAEVVVRETGSAAVANRLSVPLAADQPVEVSLAEVPPGEYTVQIDSETPVLSAVREQDGAGPETDFAWLTPAPEIQDEVLVAVPSGPSANIVVANVEETDAVVSVGTLDGEPVQTTIEAGASATIPVDARTVYSMSSTSPVHATVTMTAPGALAAWPVWPGASAQQSITVYP